MAKLSCPSCWRETPSYAKDECPYCGKRLPEAVLEVKPVAGAGAGSSTEQVPEVEAVSQADWLHEWRAKRDMRPQGPYAACPACNCPGNAKPVVWTWWGGLIGPPLLSHVRCLNCFACYNGRTGDYNTTGIFIWTAAGLVLGAVAAAIMFSGSFLAGLPGP